MNKESNISTIAIFLIIDILIFFIFFKQKVASLTSFLYSKTQQISSSFHISQYLVLFLIIVFIIILVGIVFSIEHAIKYRGVPSNRTLNKLRKELDTDKPIMIEKINGEWKAKVIENDDL
ncbi:hypothetical protein [Heyndrickxia ginsengihumi]|uniref:hypothetical protein n=1 Tax=Heyndrickxia ginsengihumi TaxID=363870 RepID=UPI00046E8C3A|nr:hypothetical protein [Heyndrickxia ginsengihumi]